MEKNKTTELKSSYQEKGFTDKGPLFEAIVSWGYIFLFCVAILGEKSEPLLNTFLMITTITGVVLVVRFIINVLVHIVCWYLDIDQFDEESIEKKRSISILRNKEEVPRFAEVSTSTDFCCKEEEMINLSYRIFATNQIKKKTIQAHIEYLSKCHLASLTLNKKWKAIGYREEIQQWRPCLKEIKSGLVFESKWCNAIYRIDEVKYDYSKWIDKTPYKKNEWVTDFFQGPKYKSIICQDQTILVFAPLYAIYFCGVSSNLRIVPYHMISIDRRIWLCELGFEPGPDDEVDRVEYLYQNSDGTRDRRYSIANNPKRSFVYRGEVIITTPYCQALISQRNKTKTESLFDDISSYIELMSDKYKVVVERMLSNIEPILTNQAITELVNAFQKSDSSKNLQKTQSKQEQTQKAPADESNQDQREYSKRTYDLPNEGKSRITYEEPVEKDYSVVDGVLTVWKGRKRQVVLEKGLFTQIGKAFKNNFFIKSVEIPEGITTIKAEAFQGCIDLKEVIIPAGVVEIGAKAFMNCSSLSKITLPEGIREISMETFAECSQMRSITIPTGVKVIGKGAFLNCTELVEIILPNGVERVEKEAFRGCAMLERIEFPDTVIDLGEDVFTGCVCLKHAHLGDGIKRVPDDCFKYKKNLINVTISAGIIEIGSRAFKECALLKELHFCGVDENLLTSNTGFTPQALNIIGQSAFEDCESFEGIEIGESVRSINDYAFANCKNIKRVSLSKELITLGNEAFRGCVSLREVEGAEYINWHRKHCFDGTPWLETQAEDGCVIFEGYLEAYTGKNSNVTIPDGVTVIGVSSFEGNSKITEVVVPASVTEIEARAFANCKGLQKITIPDSVRSIDNSAFSGDRKVVIRCTRGSFASAFRISNKILGEYISKTSADWNMRSTPKGTTNHQNVGLLGLSEEERQLIIELRRKKHEQEQKKNTPVQNTAESKLTYQIVNEDDDKIALKLLEDNRKITNNIFNLRFQQCESADGSKSIAEYEVFVVDSEGRIISDIRPIVANLSGDDLTHKVTVSLSSQDKFDKTAAYFVVVRYKDAGMSILSKTQYQISIDFVSDFDF